MVVKKVVDSVYDGFTADGGCDGGVVEGSGIVALKMVMIIVVTGVGTLKCWLLYRCCSGTVGGKDCVGCDDSSYWVTQWVIMLVIVVVDTL